MCARGIVLNRQNSEGLVAMFEGNAKPVIGGRASPLHLTTGGKFIDFLASGEQWLTAPKNIFGQALPRSSGWRRAVELIDKIRKAHPVRGLVVKRDVEVPGIEEIRDNAVDGGVEGVKVARGGGDLGDAIEGGLQFFRLAAFGDVLGYDQAGAVPLQLNSPGKHADIDDGPVLSALAPDLVPEFDSAAGGGEPLGRQVHANIGDRHTEKFLAQVAVLLDGSPIHFEEAAGGRVMEAGRLRVVLEERAEFLLRFDGRPRGALLLVLG